MATIKDLEKEAAIAEVSLEFLYDEITPLTDATTNTSQMTRLRDDLEAVYNKLAGTSQKLYQAATDVAEMTVYKDLMHPLMRKAALAMDKANEYLAKQNIPIVPPSTSAFKLERVKIPDFSGKYDEWQTFYDLFHATVHAHPSLSGAEKLTYLKASLKGEAALVVQSFQLTDANYTEAWSLLKARFNNTHEVINAHIRKLDMFKALTNETAPALRTLLDTTNECVRSLKVLKVPVDTWDLILIYLVVKKLPAETAKQWALKKSDLPTLKDLLDFLETRARGLASVPASQTQSTSSKSVSSHHVKKGKDTSTPHSCIKCSGEHYLFHCPDFKAFSIPDKSNFLKQKKLCNNCLRPDHGAANCPNKKSCFKCGQRHHTLLHVDPPSTPSPTVSSNHCTVSSPREKVILLGTLLVNVKDSRGIPQQCRVFVDNGSESHFISEHCLSRLGLKRKKVNVPLNPIGHGSGPVAKGKVFFTIHSKTEPFSLDITALILPKISGVIPAAQCQSKWSHLEGVQMSDPNFHRPHYTDILLGAAKSGHIILPEIINHPTNPNAPVAINTRFGWMLNGEAPATGRGRIPRAIHHVTVARTHDENLDTILANFWEQEEPETHPHSLSSSDVECESHFLSTHTLNADGTYTVQLPFRPNAPPLGKSRQAAVRRFHKVEERLNSQPDVKEEYVKSIREFTSLGYLEPVPPEDLRKPPSAAYYMPHREVVKESSSSTKVRVVFDASAKTSTGVSLNDTLYTGPKLQVDLFPLLLRFMSYPIAMSADVWKFYPQTTVHRDQRDFQRLVWRENPQQPLQDYRMTRVTFGVSAAPYMAIRAFHELANRVQLTHPHASQVIKEEFLVDNLLSGGHSLDQAIQLKEELLQVMEVGGLKLLKFMSNSEALMQTIPDEQRDPATFLPIDEGDFFKTIGILWNPRLDVFSVKIHVPDPPIITTKRTVVSTVARMFDPLKWLAPVTITPKILIQKMWKEGLTWDEPLPIHFHQEWRLYCEALPILQKYSLPRNAFAPPKPHSTGLTHQVHGFSDGSDLAHAACVYIRTQDSTGNAAVKLLTAKTKVNSIQKMTTPRAELCGALLLANLISSVLKSINTDITSVHCWTDSTVVLGRLSPEKKLPVYELNRIRKILAIFPAQHWNHVKGEENPADAPSRGITPRQLIDHPLWLHGPPWLLDFQPEPIPTSSFVATISPQPVTDFLMNCSLFSRMRRTLAYVHRFVHNIRHKNEKRIGQLSPLELGLALNSIIKIVQQEVFQEEIDQCTNGLVLKSKLKFLTPFLAEDGVLRVGGRLERAAIPYFQKHPALLPKNHHVVEVLARHYHIKHLHAGPTLLLSILREQFWPIRGLDLAKRTTRRCVTCHRHKAVTSSQIMGQLPAPRVNPSPTFSQTGVDYAGPFGMALRTGRKPPIIKAWVAVFICMATKATHLELVSDLSTAAFIAALTRFISRRGLPADIYSDEGTNFVGAKAELDELLAFVNSTQHNEAVQDFLTTKGVSFHTNPPAAPHHGGLWEAAVKSMKYHLRRIMGTRNLTVEEFSTLLCQVEAMLNSRPLTPLSDDPNDLSFLTPGHFLTGRPLTALPYPDLGHLPINRLDRWQMVQCLSQHIWASWHRNYLCMLQSRPKWYSPLPDLAVGTLVLIQDKDSSLGPQQWKLGRIVNVFPGLDDKTRVCDVRTNITSKTPKGSILRRPVVKLSPLPLQ